MKKINKGNPLYGLLLSVISIQAFADTANVISSPQSTSPMVQSSTPVGENWWAAYQYNQGFNDALAELGLTYEYMANNAENINNRAKNANDPLFWLKRTLSIYQDYTSSVRRYNIPLTEGHDNGKARTASRARNNYFPTHTWINSGDTLIINTAAYASGDIKCNVIVDSNMQNITGPANALQLKANGNSTYKAVTSGLVLLACLDMTKTMKHMDEQIPITLQSGGYERELFTFGLNTNSEWTQAANAASTTGYTAFFDGRSRNIVSNKKFKISSQTNILQAMRENLMSTIWYDQLNGLDGSSYLHQPSRGLMYATYDACCTASTQNGLLKIGVSSTVPSHNAWGEWHEYGHLSQMGWSWDGQDEVTVNLYSLQNCHLSLGNVDIKQCHTNSSLKGFTWDQQAVGNFLKSGQSWKFSSTDVFRRATMFGQLMTTWPDLFAKLGEAYREDDQAGANSSKLDSSTEKLDWFVTNTSRLSGYDLREYFSRWGLSWSSSVDVAIAAMKLPAPLQPTTSYEAALIHSGNSVSKALLTVPGASGRVNTAFVTNSGDKKLMSLTWKDTNPSTVKATVVNSAHQSYEVTLRATITVGQCSGVKSMNSAQNCNLGTSSYLTVKFDPKDNLALPAGHYTGKLPLIARDWKKTDWSANVNINLDITK